MTRQQPEKQLNMDNFKITERKGHHKPNTQRYHQSCGCEPSTPSGNAYRDKVAESTNTKETKWDRIRFYHQAPVVKKNADVIEVNTYGHEHRPTTRERINMELPKGFRLKQEDHEIKLEVPNGGKIKVPRRFKIDFLENSIRKVGSHDLICDLQVTTEVTA